MARGQFTDEERRRRIVERHHLARTASDPTVATRAVLALHSSDPIGPYLSCWARVPGFATSDLDAALYSERTLWRLHAMRRTLFVVATADAPILVAAAAREVARAERKRVEQMVASSLPDVEAPTWLAALEADVLEIMADGRERSTRDLSTSVPALATEVQAGSGKWARPVPLSSRLLLLMALDGEIVRGRPAGSWRSSQYGWSTVDSWFGEREPGLEAQTARAALAHRYLERYGPASVADLRWWTGWTARACADAVRDAGAVEVALESGGVGLALPDDLEPTAAAGADQDPIALLPSLDPTAMGWRERSWYLCDGAEQLFDRNGNVGPTVWVGGRVVGGWGQGADGAIRYRLIDDVAPAARRCVSEEAARLSEWLGGTPVTPRFRTPLERGLAG